MNEDIKSTLSIIPHQPGCYQFYDEEGKVIYIGKAKNLKKRVSSYFNKEHDSPKTRILVRKIAKIKYIVVKTEEDTFLLENNLIKQYQPRYNVLLKDDKTYPSIVVKKEYFPRVMQTRNIQRDGSRYFGPYTSVMSVKALLETIRKVYKLRTCTLNLTPENIKAGKFKVCLQYHIERCKGPCEGLQSLEDYNKNIDEILEILKGNVGIISKKIYEEMTLSAENLQFEEAQELKEKYLMIENFRERSTVVSNFGYNIDVFFCSDDKQAAYINYLHVVNGAIIQAYTFEYRKKMDETKEELLAMGIVEMRQRYKSESKEIIVPFIPDIKLTNVEFTIPQRGDKRKLLALSEQNVKQYRVDKLKRAEILNPEQRSTRLLKTVQKDLHLKELPIHIECFDNSNIQGTNPVAACVVFKKGKPVKKEYRHFTIKSVVGANDYASMQEVIQRRYSRAVNEGGNLPQLIVVDGGKGQLSAAVEKLRKMNLYGKIAIIGIAERLEEIYFPNDSIPLYLDKNSETLKLIQYLRDEAHRFGLAFHRKKRSKAQVGSELDKIKGIGPKSKRDLLNHFKSIKRIREAKESEIVEVLGKNRGKIVYNWFNKKSKMRVLIQRVSEASVTIDKNEYSSISKGLLILVGIENDDADEDIDYLCKKIINLRIFDDAKGVMNESILKQEGQMMVISQFTLHANTKKGNRPSYIKAAKPDIAIPIYEKFCKKLEVMSGIEVKTGQFGADMKVSLINDGPVTIWIDSKDK